MKNYDKNLKLDSEGIEEVLEVLDDTLKKSGTERVTKMRVMLSVEEALLRFRDHFGSDQVMHVFIGNYLGRYEIHVELTGEAFNPLRLKDDDAENWSSSLLSSIGISPNYSYMFGRNNLRLVLPHKSMNPVYKLLLCIFLGLLFGLAGKALIPQAVQTVIIAGVLEPVSNLWGRVLTCLAGPLIFILVLTTVLNMGHIDIQGGNKTAVIARYIAISTTVGLLTLLLCNWVLPVDYEVMAIGSGEVSGFLDILFGIVPEDAIFPFIQVNTAQLVFMAFVLGNAIAFLKGDGDLLERFIRQLYDVGIYLADGVGKAVPFFTVVLLTLAIWNGQISLFANLWIVALLFGVMTLAVVIAALLVVSLHWHISIGLLLNKLKESFIVSLRTGSVNEAYPYIENICTNKLGIEKHFAKASLPSGLVLYMPVSVIELIVFSIYAAGIYGNTTSFGWYFMLLFLAVVLSMASPPISGISLISFMTIFFQLSIPKEALVGGMIADIILGTIASAFNQMMLQMDLLMQADRIGLVNTHNLMKDTRKANADGR